MRMGERSGEEVRGRIRSSSDRRLEPLLLGLPEDGFVDIPLELAARRPSHVDPEPLALLPAFREPLLPLLPRQRLLSVLSSRLVHAAAEIEVTD